jgi:hypothetical protein
MAKCTQNKKVLLIEPDYKNKFPPVGLMKIASYYRNLGGWDVWFYKGDLNHFVVERIVDNLIETLNENDDQDDVDWYFYKGKLIEFIKYRRKDILEQLPISSSPFELQLLCYINDAKDSFYQKTWKKEWDRVGVTTLFTFYWDKTVETINFAKKYLVKNPDNLMVGGVLASIQPNELAKETGLKIHQHGEPGGIHIGILRVGDLDINDKQPIDELELDYSILDEIDYKYEMSNAYYRYTTRGCVNKCAFCAVPTLEPDYQEYIPLKARLERVNNLYGEQKDLLLMDNNVLASKDYETIINEILDCGFHKGAKFIAPDYLAIAIKNLKDEINDRAYIKKAWNLIRDFYYKLKNSQDVYEILKRYNMLSNDYPPRKSDVLAAYAEIKETYEKHHIKSKGVLRFVDFNQGMDARLFTPAKAELLSKIAIRPVRIAFDDIKYTKKYVAAIRMCAKVGINDFSNYLLYNFKDKPVDLYKRMRINVDLCDELSEETGLKVSIYSFPMKFHPIRKTADMKDHDYSHDRDYIGINWNRKFIRAVQAVLNSTKGKIGRGTSFFNEAFGSDEKEFEELLYMPEPMIIYRFLFKWIGTDEAHDVAKQIIGSDEVCDYSTSSWRNCFRQCEKELPSDLWEDLKKKIGTNDFVSDNETFTDSLEKRLLWFYGNNRKNVTDEKSDICKMKNYYDKYIKDKPSHYGKKNG